jgi:hypothetical protein
MNYRVMTSTLLLACVATTSAFASARKEANEYKTASIEHVQSVHVVNLLANSTIPDPGMTKTPIMVRFYNGNTWPCWSFTINYQDDYVIYAGPNMGCVAKVTQIVIEPVLVADKLNTYRTPDRVYLDTTKYSSHVLITQEQPPLFDTQSGLVTSSGTMHIQVQTDS